jgi:hypothetical protein
MYRQDYMSGSQALGVKAITGLMLHRVAAAAGDFCKPVPESLPVTQTVYVDKL